jgi:hypothetical protein
MISQALRVALFLGLLIAAPAVATVRIATPALLPLSQHGPVVCGPGYGC